MDKNKILQGFDGFAAAKRSSVITLRLVLLFALLVVLAAMGFSWSVSRRAMDTVKVVDASTGLYLKTSLADENRLLLVRVKQHCSQVTEYANSFDRLTIKENQTKMIFRCNPDDARRIFAWYQSRRGYGDALERGVVYKTNFQQLDSLQQEEAYYRVVFTSQMTIDDNGEIIGRYSIRSQGRLRLQTPQFPENAAGLYFTEYAQTWTPLIATP